MNHLIQKSIVGFLGVGLALISTGCMTSPGHGEIVGNKNDHVNFGGYLLDGNEWVQIQAKHPTYGWQTIDWAQSKSNTFHYDGSNWHPWHQSIQIPDVYWTSIGYGYVKAEVRAVQYSTGNRLPTFYSGFDSYFDPEVSLGEMWNEYGYGSTATIYATH